MPTSRLDDAPQPRVLRCPKCRQTFETMRRWRLACTECGHEWEEVSKLSFGDHLRDAAGEAWSYVFVGLAWLTILAFAAAIVGLYVYLIVMTADRVGLAEALVFATVVMGVIVVVAFAMRPRMETLARFQWWVPNWRGPRERDRR